MTYNFFRIEHGETFAFGTLFNGKDDTGVGVDMAKSVFGIGCIMLIACTDKKQKQTDIQKLHLCDEFILFTCGFSILCWHAKLRIFI